MKNSVFVLVESDSEFFASVKEFLKVHIVLLLCVAMQYYVISDTNDSLKVFKSVEQMLLEYYGRYLQFNGKRNHL